MQKARENELKQLETEKNKKENPQPLIKVMKKLHHQVLLINKIW